MTRVGTDVLREIAGRRAVGARPSTRSARRSRRASRMSRGRATTTKYIVHFPDTLEVWSFGSGYGGNAILAKKCFALRIASRDRPRRGLARRAHAADPRHSTRRASAYHVAAAFPSACGKTNLAMLRPTIPGWRVETIGDDIAWLRPGDDGRLWAINPEAGFFGVAPGTGESTNVTAVETLWGNTIFTNVALRPDGDVWWEGLTDEAARPPHRLGGQPLDARLGSPRRAPELALHRRARPSARRSPTTGRPRRACRSTPSSSAAAARPTCRSWSRRRDWTHGVFMGSNISSERTAAAEGTVGELRRDPFAMLPFCGYNMADYFGHWLKVGQKLRFDRAPRIFQVNWFRKGADGRFLWPGFGDNSRVHRLDHPPHRGRGRRRREPDRPPAAHRGPQPRRHRRAAGRPRRAVRDRPRLVAARGRPHRGVLRDRSTAGSRRRCRPSSPRCATASQRRLAHRL